jgi:hypothetical protein
MRNAYKIAVGKSERRRNEDNLNMNLRYWVSGLDSTGSGQCPTQGSSEYGKENSNFIKGRKSLKIFEKLNTTDNFSYIYPNSKFHGNQF